MIGCLPSLKLISKSFAFVSCYVLRCYTSRPRRNYDFETSCIRLISPYLHLWFWPFVLRGLGRGRQDISLSHLNFATGLTSDSKISTTYGKSVAIGSHLFLSASRHSCDCFACSLPFVRSGARCVVSLASHFCVQSLSRCCVKIMQLGQAFWGR